MDTALYDEKTGKPVDKEYLECDLPPFLKQSIETMEKAWWLKEHDKSYMHWDCDWCDLQSDIGCAEAEQLITSEQAWYLREKYLHIRKDGEL